MRISGGSAAWSEYCKLHADSASNRQFLPERMWLNHAARCSYGTFLTISNGTTSST